VHSTERLQGAVAQPINLIEPGDVGVYRQNLCAP
jgi:hypothetical protein